MADFIGADLRGSRFERADLSGAKLFAVDLSGARFRGVDLSGAVLRGVELAGVDITGEIEDVTINGVDIGPLINAELDRRDPDRAKMRPADPAGFREAWGILERRWDQTVERARRLPPELLHESVDGEWSFIETLRHLVFVTDAWSGGRSSATRRRGIPWTCHGTRCLTRRGSPATAAHGPRWRPCSNCAATGCPPCGRSSRA
jgi:hypothetical protein